MMKSADIPPEEEDRLRQLKELEILDTIEESAYDDLTEIAAHICDTPISLVSLVDNDRQWFKSHHGLDAKETPREYAFCSHAILQDQVFEIKDSREDDRFHDNPLVKDNPHVIFYAGFPLEVNNHKVGTLCVIDHKPKTLTKEQLATLTALGRQVESQLKLRLSNKELTTANKILKNLSATDPLTQLPNRRIIFEVLNSELKRSARDKKNISIIMVDIDFFKDYNDNYGHVAGDECIKKVSDGLKSVLKRPGDIVGRYGGEEFIYILPDTDEKGAVRIANEALEKINNLNIEHKLSKCSDQLTISLGVATNYSDQKDYLCTAEKLIDLADDALYEAKEAGRNQFKISE